MYVSIRRPHDQAVRMHMLIDKYLTVYEAVERHELIVPVGSAEVYAAIRKADFGEVLPIRWLLWLRSLPAAFAGRKEKQRLAQSRYILTLDTFLSHGFHLLAEKPGEEILIGLVGRFWTPTAELEATDPILFRRSLGPGKAQAAWNFTVHEISPGRTVLATETRVHCSDADSLRSFRRYWFAIRPFSGLMRRLMLRAIRQTCMHAYMGRAVHP